MLTEINVFINRLLDTKINLYNMTPHCSVHYNVSWLGNCMYRLIKANNGHTSMPCFAVLVSCDDLKGFEKAIVHTLTDECT